MKTYSNAELMMGRTPQSRGRDMSTYRQSRRRTHLAEARQEITKRFAGTGRGGNLQWPEELCPRRRRRSIIRAKAKRHVD
jgi:hypothetical protein